MTISKTITTALTGLFIALPAFGTASGESGVLHDPAGRVDASGSEMVASGWIASKVDNICGLTDSKTLSNPGVVEYTLLLEATPEIRRMRSEGIKPDSPKGKKLRQEAAQRITRASETSRSRTGRCSVWKRIRHTDGRKARNVTGLVRSIL